MIINNFQQSRKQTNKKDNKFSHYIKKAKHIYNIIIETDKNTYVQKLQPLYLLAMCWKCGNMALPLRLHEMRNPLGPQGLFKSLPQKIHFFFKFLAIHNFSTLIMSLITATFHRTHLPIIYNSCYPYCKTPNPANPGVDFTFTW